MEAASDLFTCQTLLMAPGCVCFHYLGSQGHFSLSLLRTHSLTHFLTHFLTHALTHALAPSLPHSLGRSLIYSAHISRRSQPLSWPYVSSTFARSQPQNTSLRKMAPKTVAGADDDTAVREVCLTSSACSILAQCTDNCNRNARWSS